MSKKSVTQMISDFKRYFEEWEFKGIFLSLVRMIEIQNKKIETLEQYLEQEPEFKQFKKENQENG